MIHFHIGQRVLCVAIPPETWGEWWYRIRHPSKYQDVKVGEVYTVANVYADDDDMLMIEVAEIYAPDEEWWVAGFKASGFRPLCAKKTNIGIFTSILDVEHKKLSEPV